jgi:hypothetical protein
MPFDMRKYPGHGGGKKCAEEFGVPVQQLVAVGIRRADPGRQCLCPANPTLFLISPWRYRTFKKTASPSMSGVGAFECLRKFKKDVGAGAVICLRQGHIPLSKNVMAVNIGYL